MANLTKKENFWSHFGEICEYSWRSMLAHPWILLWLFVLNVGFVFLFSFYQQPVGDKIAYSIDLLSQIFQTIIQAVDVPGFISAASGTSLISVITNDALVQKLVQDIVLLLALLGAIAYVVYTFFQSTSVRLIGWMVLDKRPYSLLSFIRLNLIWFIIYLLARVMVLIVDLVFTFVSKGTGMISSLDFLYTIIHVVIFYFAFISYTYIGLDKFSSWRAIKTSIKTGIKFSTLPYYFVNYIPFLLFLIPWTKNLIIAPVLNLLSFFGGVGYGLQLAILFFFYVFYVANIFTITHEVSLDAGGM